MFDVVTFGSATVDIFVESDKAHVVNIRGVEGEIDLYCLKYGEKIEIDHSAFEIGGGAVNTASCFSRLGLNTAAAVKIGQGANSKLVWERLKENNISTEFVMTTDEERTGFSVILTSFEGDRTVLAHRGANITLRLNDINFDKLKETKWLYCAPLNSKYENILEPLAEFAATNNIKIAHNLGGRALDKSIEELAPVFRNLNILSLNTQEATRITGIEQRYIKDKNIIINDDVKEMLRTFKQYVKDIVLITDGKKGAYAYDGTHFYYAPIFPTKRVSSLGAGDAFASTFCAACIMEKDIMTALELASINSGYVVTFYGAQEGLLPLEKLIAIKEENPEYKTIIVE